MEITFCVSVCIFNIFHCRISCQNAILVYHAVRQIGFKIQGHPHTQDTLTGSHPVHTPFTPTPTRKHTPWRSLANPLTSNATNETFLMLFKQCVQATGFHILHLMLREWCHTSSVKPYVENLCSWEMLLLLKSLLRDHDTTHFIWWWKWKKIGFSSRGLAFKLHLAAAAAYPIHCFKALMPNKPLRLRTTAGNLLQFFRVGDFLK